MLSAQNASLKLKFQTDLNEIDGDTFVQAFVGLTRVIWAVNDGLETGKRVNVRLKATESGSFVVDIEILMTALEQIKSLFSDNSTAAEVVMGVVAVLGVAKSFGAGKAESDKGADEKTSGSTASFSASDLTNAQDVSGTGNTVIVNQHITQIFEAPETRKGIRQLAEAVNNDPEVNGFELQGNDATPMFDATSEECGEIVGALPAREEPQERIITRRETLAIIKPSFDPRYVWEFLLLGNRVTARVTDQVFWQKVLNGETFRAGDLLDVELTISQEFDVRAQAYVAKQFQASKVYDHRSAEKPPTQTLMFKE